MKNVNFDYSYQLNNQVSCGLNPSGEFQINNNKFSGQLPEEIYNIISLKYLYLHNNMFTGPLLSDVGKLKLLEKLVLNNNEFSGPLPSELGTLNHLGKFFTSNILVDNNDKLTPFFCFNPDTLWVHFNKFEGAMPESICTRRLSEDEPESVYADCFGKDAAVTCNGGCCTHCCHNQIFYCFET